MLGASIHLGYIWGMPSNTTRQEAAAHDRTIRDMFAGIAGVYDRMNGLLSLGQDAAWRRALADRIDPEADDLVDLCCGTGELILTAQARGRGSRHVAADFCLPMLVEGTRAHDLARRARVLAADTQRLPFPDASFDVAMAAFGLRNLGDLSQGLREIHRILRPGGQLLVLEFYRQQRGWVEAPIAFYLRHGVPLLGRLFGGSGEAYGYLPRSMGRFLTVDEFAAALVEAGFSQRVERHRQSFGVAHLVVARRPA